MLTPFVATLGGGSFLVASWYIIKDRERAQTAMIRTEVYSFDEFN